MLLPQLYETTRSPQGSRAPKGTDHSSQRVHCCCVRGTHKELQKHRTGLQLILFGRVQAGFPEEVTFTLGAKAK